MTSLSLIDTFIQFLALIVWVNFLQLLHQSSLYHPELECCGGGLTPKHSITLFWKLLTWLCSLTHCVTLYLKAVEVATFLKSHSTISPVSLSFPSSLSLSIFLDKKWATLLIVILSKRWYGSFYLSTWEDIFPDSSCFNDLQIWFSSFF